MKLLTRLLLINWHYIKYQCIDFSDINFLTGKNGSGKSTIIDALQLVLLGDTSGYYFNKAANDKSQRSLKGYLRGEVAEDEETNTVYLRNDDFSSYLVLEFHDQKSNQLFCLGVGFDCYDDGSHDHQFFYLNDRLPDNHFIDKGTELNRKGLKAFFFNNYPKGRYEFFETNSKYQEVALGKLGQINKKFFRLLKKAVPFSPIMDIKGFISEFVCDVENKIDITDMQENIRYYKQLEHDLEIVKKKIGILKEVENQHESYCEELQRLETQKYLIDRGIQEQLQNRVVKILKDINRLREKIVANEGSLLNKENELTSLQEERDRLFAEKINSDVYRKREELGRQIEDLQRERKAIEHSKDILLGLVKSVLYTWREVYQWCRENLVDMPLLEEQLGYLANISEVSLELITREKGRKGKSLAWNIETQKDDIYNKYEAAWVEAVGEPRFRQELSQRKDPENMVNTFTTTVKGTQSRIDNKWKAMLETRIIYNRDYNGALDVNAPGNSTYDQELRALEDTSLVLYEEKIKDAQEKAQEQFKEDFISKLKKNIEDAREQIDDLNKALKDIPFGRDKYRFTVTPNPHYKKYYEIITDDMLLEGLTLFSASFQSKYQDVVEELFRQIIDVDEGLVSADRREELNKNLDKFTDYRTHLDFDLAVTDDRGMESRLSRVIAKKSGGETQTPFYISVLAPF